MVEKLNSLAIKAKIKKDQLIDSLKTKEDGLDQPIIILIIIAVAAGVIGAFYLYAKGTLVPSVENQLNDNVTNWFDPN